jgi:hypothetical protein
MKAILKMECRTAEGSMLGPIAISMTETTKTDKNTVMASMLLLMAQGMKAIGAEANAMEKVFSIQLRDKRKK